MVTPAELGAGSVLIYTEVVIYGPCPTDVSWMTWGKLTGLCLSVSICETR